MRSRVLAGLAAWLLGAAAATGGSLVVVDQLAHGLLAQPSQQLTGAAVRADLADENSDHPAAPRTPASTARSPAPPGRPRQSAGARPAPAGTLLTTSAGTVMASCRAGLAYLEYWSPEQGYEADDVTRGPAAEAKVTFTGSGGGLVMKVTCRDGTPDGQVSPVPPGGSGWHDE